jgi:cyclase
MVNGNYENQFGKILKFYGNYVILTRLIARLDIKGPNLIKGINLEGLRVIGDPNEYAVKYYEQGIDELLFMDAVASLYGRNHLSEIIKNTSKNTFIPITVGGGIRSVENVAEILMSGADKVAINTAAVANPILISRISQMFGSQCLVLSIEAKKIAEGKWEVYTNGGREKTGINVKDWAIQGFEMGAGEILVTSIDRDGTKQGLDIELVRSISSLVNVPIIASGGIGSKIHLKEALKLENISGVAMGSVLHYDHVSVGELKSFLQNSGFKVRVLEN